MYIEELENAVIGLTGRPDVPIYTTTQIVCEEIRRSGRYVEDFRIEYVNEDTNPWQGYWYEDDRNFEIENSYWNSGNQLEMSGTPIIESLTAIVGNGNSSPVLFKQITTTEVRQYRGCKYPNYFRLTGPASLEGHAQSNPFEHDAELAYYSRAPMKIEDSKSIEEPWPFQSCPDLVIIGVAAKVMLAAGDDPSRDRLYTEFQRLLRQFQLSRIEVPPI